MPRFKVTALWEMEGKTFYISPETETHGTKNICLTLDHTSGFSIAALLSLL